MNNLLNRRRSHVTDRALLDALREGEIGHKIAAEAAATDLAGRLAIAGEIRAIEADRDKQLPALTSAKDAARDAVEKARRAYLEADRLHQDAAAAARSVTVSADSRINHLRHRLAEAADPAIDELLTEIADAQELYRRELPVYHTPTLYLGESRMSSEQIAQNRSLADAHAAIHTVLQDAYWATQAIKSEALTDDELASRLAAIREELNNGWEAIASAQARVYGLPRRKGS